MKSNSDNNDCTAHTGAIDNVHWKVYATGRNCDTSAQLDTIRGAITVYLEEQNNEICGASCIKVTHGGTYAGFVAIAPAGTSLDSYHCGQSYTFGNCVSGGEDDV
jgi:hypothetical protein